MTVDSAVKLIDAATKLLSVLAWPAVLVFVLVRFGPALRRFIRNVREFSLKGAGFEASVKRVQAEAAVAVRDAVLSRATSESTAREARAAARGVAEIATPQMIRLAEGGTVLWVDDRPGKNVHERHALRVLGIHLTLATSTDAALEKIKHQTFDVIISDMSRPPDPQAGYTLLDKLREGGDETPFIIYAGSRAPEHIAEARRKGAYGCTNRPDELLRMVLDAMMGLGRGRAAAL